VDLATIAWSKLEWICQGQVAAMWVLNEEGAQLEDEQGAVSRGLLSFFLADSFPR